MRSFEMTLAAVQDFDGRVLSTSQDLKTNALVCGNTADRVSRSRFGAHFKVLGGKTTHFGPFDCAPPVDVGGLDRRRRRQRRRLTVK